MNWGRELINQLGWHWQNQLRPRLDGLTDEEYLWEPVHDCWSIRQLGEAVSADPRGAGDYLIDWEYPEPDPPPVTTIAWRIGHIAVPVLGARAATTSGKEASAELPPTGHPDPATALPSSIATTRRGCKD